MEENGKAGKYELRTVIGRGAAGVVFEGWDPVLARKVAIKTLPLPGKDEESVEQYTRFKQEAQAAARLHHPNIVAAFDYGETSTHAFIVMEYLSGGSLKARMERDRRMPTADAVLIMRGLLAGLQHSHEHGVVHRDIKPANVVFDEQGVVKITDFGIARLESSSLTQAGAVMGTPAYMSPEQVMGEAADLRSDLYSAGVIFYEMLTGQRPFEGAAASIMHKIVTVPPPPPSGMPASVPSRFDPVIARALAKAPGDRYQTAADFASALPDDTDAAESPDLTLPLLRPQIPSEPLASRTSGVAPEASVPPLPRTEPARPAALPSPQKPREKSGTRLGVVAVVVALLLLGAGAGVARLTGLWGGSPPAVVADGGGSPPEPVKPPQPPVRPTPEAPPPVVATPVVPPSVVPPPVAGAPTVTPPVVPPPVVATPSTPSTPPTPPPQPPPADPVVTPPPQPPPPPVVTAPSPVTPSVPAPGPLPAPVIAAPAKGEFRGCEHCPVMATLDAGVFAMGSNDAPAERPVHRVSMPSFAISKFPVSRREWGACAAASGCSFTPPASDGDAARMPMAGLSWNDAMEYVQWLRAATGKPYRLPSEAEWEYAARAATTTRYWWGDDAGSGHADCEGCGGAHDAATPSPPDAFGPNPWGLFGMGGGVAQLAEDCWHLSYLSMDTPVDGTAWSTPGCPRHVLRGGDWTGTPAQVSVSARAAVDAGARAPGNGLRVVLSLP